MSRDRYGELQAFLNVAREGSFTKAAALLGVSQSALSHTIRGLEAHLGIRLLHRTTRSVSPTDAGQRLLERIAPHFNDIDAEIAAISALRDKPAGSVRISASDNVAQSLLWPRLAPVLRQYPDIQLEINIDFALTNIVERRLDAGVRLGEQLEKDMIAVPISPAVRMAAIASPGYFQRNPIPQVPQDLLMHNCINFRLPTYGGLYAWEFEKDGRELNIQVKGQLTCNTSQQVVAAALDGTGIGFLTEDTAIQFLREGKLIRVLEDWCPPFSGYHLYYPNRREPTPAFQIVVEALRWPPRF
ncbi:LysR substrate-binding domain-containing protein [Candidatus Thalassolituus haligoni]|uniref:LysR substrate-binding domain-containing protein n=1 Tax=Candidatus Thalassolituus haligoni TaxID=3100113 RepID=UPI003512AAA3|tara:strand:- start:7647 stop:8546 length:900 start_codon:yes stop_codon:yes gene_type:complete